MFFGPDKFHASVFCTNEVIGTDEKRMGGKVLHSLLNMLIRNWFFHRRTQRRLCIADK